MFLYFLKYLITIVKSKVIEKSQILLLEQRVTK